MLLLQLVQSTGQDPLGPLLNLQVNGGIKPQTFSAQQIGVEIPSDLPAHKV